MLEFAAVGRESGSGIGVRQQRISGSLMLWNYNILASAKVRDSRDGDGSRHVRHRHHEQAEEVLVHAHRSRFFRCGGGFVYKLKLNSSIWFV